MPDFKNPGVENPPAVLVHAAKQLKASRWEAKCYSPSPDHQLLERWTCQRATRHVGDLHLAFTPGDELHYWFGNDLPLYSIDASMTQRQETL